MRAIQAVAFILLGAALGVGGTYGYASRHQEAMQAQLDQDSQKLKEAQAQNATDAQTIEEQNQQITSAKNLLDSTEQAYEAQKTQAQNMGALWVSQSAAAMNCRSSLNQIVTQIRQQQQARQVTPQGAQVLLALMKALLR